MEKFEPCWKHFQCDTCECPAFGTEHAECWQIATAMKPDDDPEIYLDQLSRCLTCALFKSQMTPDRMETTCRMISEQFFKAREEIQKRDRELKAVNSEMSSGLSEVFSALKKISAGDPTVRIPETSGLEVIAQLKRLVNDTAENLSEIIDLSHEFAMGLAEHFDVLNRVAAGDLEARVAGASPVELLEALKEVTNEMIESVEREIGQRKQALADLRKSEERFRTFAENAPIGITIMRPDTVFEYINPTFTEMFGYAIEDIPDKMIWFNKAYPDPEYRDSVMAIWKKYAQKGTKTSDIKPGTYTVRCADGRSKIVNFRTVVLKDGKHFTTYADITERARAEEAIRESEEKYRVLIENIQDGVFIVQDGVLRFVNEALCRMVGYASGEIIGQPFHLFLAPDDRERISIRYGERLRGKERNGDIEFRLLHKDGKTLIDVVSTSDTLTFRNRTALIGTLKNVTERKTAQKEKAVLEAQLQRSQKMEAIGSLAGGVAHDLNNILSGLVSYPELLLMELPPGSPLTRSILTIKKSGEKAAAIVQDLLTLARRGVAAMEVVDLNSVVIEYLKSPEYETLCMFHPALRMTMDLDPDLLKIMGSPVHLSKTIMNLVSNAAEAMPDGGFTCITTRNQYLDRPVKGFESVTAGDYVVLSVADMGVGISREDLDRIFEPFYTKKIMGRSGTGLGMAVVWGTVKDHHGYIDVMSDPGKGTTFTLYFPVTRNAPSPKECGHAVSDYMSRGESVLIVDDVAEQREIASIMLTKLGYRVTAVASGEEALEFLKRNSPDVMVLDMIMEPGMDGLETFQRAVSIRPGQKAVLASGFAETERVKKAQQLGAGQYVKKPYTLEKIGLAVKAALKGDSCGP